MSKREDIIDGKAAPGRRYGLIYTRRCGWVDLGHADGTSARELYQNVQVANIQKRNRSFHYAQTMGNRLVKVGVGHLYSLQAALSPAQVKSVALGVFMSVSKDFEGMQGNLFWRQFTDSGFSGEDLISDLIGFYRAVDAPRNYIMQCQPVSKQEALFVWDTYGPVGQHKNKSFNPYIYPTTPHSKLGPMQVPLPAFLNTIVPEAPGRLYKKEM